MRDLVEWVYGVVKRACRPEAGPGEHFDVECGGSSAEAVATNVRLQTFPKSFAEWFMKCWTERESEAGARSTNVSMSLPRTKGATRVRFDPKDFDVVLSMVFADGCLFASLRTDVPTSDSTSRHDRNAVCKAQVRYLSFIGIRTF